MLSSNGTSESQSPPSSSSQQPPVEPNLAFIASHETVSTSGTSPPSSRLVPQAPLPSTNNRPSTLSLNNRQHQRIITASSTASGSSSLLTPNDYNKLILSTPELDEKVRGYTVNGISTTNSGSGANSATGNLQTPDPFSSIANALMNGQTTPSSSVFISDGQPSPGMKVLEELLNAHQQQQQQQTTTLAHLLPAAAAATNGGGTSPETRQFLILPSDAQAILQQLTTGQTNGDQLGQLAAALQKAVASAASTPTASDGQSQAQETLVALMNNNFVQQQQPIQLSPGGNTFNGRNRSISSSMDTSINGNDSSSPGSNSNSSNAAQSPMSSSQRTIHLGTVKDEPQHVPHHAGLNHHNNNTRVVRAYPGTGGGGSANNGGVVQAIDMETNEVLKKEKKRERNRQAAQKCRTRKLNRIAELQKRVNELQDNNRNLSSAAERLKIEINKLEHQLQDHQSHGCTLITTSAASVL